MGTEAAGTPELKLKEEFPPISTAEWEAVIHADLKGADYEKKLVWKTEEGIGVRPYYRSENVTPADLAPGQFPFTRGAGQDWAIVQELPSGADVIDAGRFHEAGATAIQELGYALAEGVERLAAAADPAAEAQKLTFVFSIGSNYFFEIAKLRAARELWAQAVAAFGVTGDAARMRVHAKTALANKSLYDSYTNLLRVTTEALSAAIGGCDALTVQAVGFADRLSKNVQLILKEEAHLSAVSDPAGGSYYVEAITEALSREAWKLLQQVEAEGGFAKTQSSGSIDAAIGASRAAKEKAMASRRKVMVGVNNYPDIKETILDHQPAVPNAIWRQAESFEKIRLRTERHSKKTGKTPRVLLLKRGDLKMRMARAMFCLNFFGCAGFDIVEGDALDAKADLVVLCSSDPEYLDLAKEVIGQVKVPVVVAGNPKEQIDALKEAGVAGFVHVFSNQVDTLTEWQNKLGVEA